MAQISVLVILVLTMTLANSTFGKGITVELSITGPGLSTALHTTDADAIDVSVWGGNFADWDNGIIEEPSQSMNRYLVHFWVSVPRSTVVRLKYVVWYVWDSELQRALIYLPGPRDQWYRTNVYSILREGADGHWFYASEGWGMVIKEVLEIE